MLHLKFLKHFNENNSRSFYFYFFWTVIKKSCGTLFMFSGCPWGHCSMGFFGFENVDILIGSTRTIYLFSLFQLFWIFKNVVKWKKNNLCISLISKSLLRDNYRYFSSVSAKNHIKDCLKLFLKVFWWFRDGFHWIIPNDSSMKHIVNRNSFRHYFSNHLKILKKIKFIPRWPKKIHQVISLIILTGNLCAIHQHFLLNVSRDFAEKKAKKYTSEEFF